MSTGRWEQLRSLFEAVCELDPEQRARELERLCDDPALRLEVEALVDAQTLGLRRAAPAMNAALSNIRDTELVAGDVLGAWRLKEHLASGGMGAVFLAERADGQYEQRAAIKLLRGLPSATSLEHLLRERQILARLEHPCIARLLDGGTTPEGQPYLVMEYIDGMPLDSYCRHHRLGLDARLRLIEQIAAALSYAHGLLILHCDLKPSNVLVRGDGRPALLDFGIARLLDANVAEQSSPSGLTPGYASPEQHQGLPLTLASDIYGLGRLTAELLADRKLKREQVDGGQILPSHLAAADCEWRRKLPGDLDALTAKATAVNPDQRYASADAFIQDLRRYRQHRPLQARGRAPLYSLSKLLRRQRAALLVILAFGLLLILGVQRIIDERNQALQARNDAQVQADAAQQVSEFLVRIFESANPAQHGGREPSVRETLDSSTLALQEQLQDQPRIRARLLDVAGQVYGGIGLPEQAIALREQATQLFRDMPGHERELILALSQLAVYYSISARIELSEQRLDEAQALLQAYAPSEPLLLAELANSRGLLRAGQGRHKEAHSEYHMALRVRREHLGNEHLHVASTLHNMALNSNAQGEHQAAVSYLREALRIKIAAQGELHPSTVLSMESLGVALRGMGRLDEAIAQLEAALALRLQLQGEFNHGTLHALNELSITLHDAGHLQAAEAQFRRALVVSSEITGVEHYDHALLVNNLGFLLQDLGRHDEAIAMYRESLRIRRLLMPDNDIRVIRAAANLGLLLALAGHADEAARILDQSQHWLEQAPHVGEEMRLNVALRVVWQRLLAGQYDGLGPRLDALQQAPENALSARNKTLLALLQAKLALRNAQTDALPSAERALLLRREDLKEGNPGLLPWLLLTLEAAIDAEQCGRAAELATETQTLIAATQVEESPSRRQLLSLNSCGG